MIPEDFIAMTWVKVIILCILVAVVFAGGGVTLGHKMGSETGQKDGYTKGYRIASAGVVPQEKFDTLYNFASNLEKDHNQLVADYNGLRDGVNKYIQAVQSTRTSSPSINFYESSTYRSPLNCTSYSYGVNDRFLSTNCY